VFLSSVSSRRLLLIAVAFHLTFAITIAIIGKTQILPNTFDTNGNGISFAIDSVTYRHEALKMTELLQQGRLRDWWSHKSQFSTLHVRLYSVCLAVVGGLVGYGILGVEPLNLLYYVSILTLVYFSGVLAFSETVGRLAAMMVGLWPSFLLYSTQLLKDPPFIACFLLLIVCLIACVRASLTTTQSVKYAIVGSLALLLVLLVRSAMWEVVLAALLTGFVVSCARQVRQRRFELQTTVALLVLLTVAFALPRAFPNLRISDRIQRAPVGRRLDASSRNTAGLSGLANQVRWVRAKFIAGYRGAGSTIDTNVQLNTTRDLIVYFPRAAEIGFLAPFPNMWTKRGVQVGLAGRLLAGVEMAVLYVLLGLAAFEVFYDRKQLPVLFLFTVASIGCIVLGYVVVNVGALYRMRYGYFILLIVLAARGFQLVRERLTVSWRA